MQRREWFVTLDSVPRIELKIHFAGLNWPHVSRKSLVSKTQIIDLDDLRGEIYVICG